MRTIYFTSLCYILLQLAISGEGFAIKQSSCNQLKSLLGLKYGQIDNSTKKPDMRKISITLHTPENKTNYILPDALDVLNNPEFDMNLPLTIVIHGFMNSNSSSFPTEMPAYLVKRGGLNVLMMDTNYYYRFYYFSASTFAQFIGEGIGNTLASFCAAGISASNIHLIGHSLGAHTAGVAGKTFTTLTGNKIKRISGLDPAGPCFTDGASNTMLASTDAEHVDVIHSNFNQFGIEQTVGHVDFYPNGGGSQPGAPMLGQSHGRSSEFYQESILNPQNFIGVQCDSWKSFQEGLCVNNKQAVMGYESSPLDSGTYYLRTLEKSPYGLGIAGISPDYTDTKSLKNNSFTLQKISNMKALSVSYVTSFIPKLLTAQAA